MKIPSKRFSSSSHPLYFVDVLANFHDSGSSAISVVFVVPSNHLHFSVDLRFTILKIWYILKNSYRENCVWEVNNLCREEAETVSWWYIYIFLSAIFVTRPPIIWYVFSLPPNSISHNYRKNTWLPSPPPPPRLKTPSWQAWQSD